MFFKDPVKKDNKIQNLAQKVTPNSDSDNDIMMMIALISDDSDGDKGNRQ